MSYWGIRAWRDTHPRYPTVVHELKSGISLELPAGWPSPDEELSLIEIGSLPDRREGSLDQLRWNITIRDHGVKVPMESVIGELRSGDSGGGRIKDILLANGVISRSWIYQEYRVYVFKAPNGHVYSVLEPMARDWRTQARYGRIFRTVLASMKFKS